MKKIFTYFIMMTLALLFTASGSFAANSISASSYKAGDVVEIKGKIAPGQDLYLAIAQQEIFAPKDTNGAFEIKRFKKDGKKKGFAQGTQIPPLYYMITNVPDKFGKVDKKRFGGPSVLMKKGQGLYSTTMFYLKKKLSDVDATARGMLGPIKSDEQWNFFKYANESGYGINTIVKEGSRKGKIVIFSRSVIGDQSSGNYWDKGTSVKLDKATGEFTASFKSFRHTPPNTKFDVYVNSAKIGDYTVEKKGFWLSKGYRYMNPLWIVIGAILVGTYFSMIGAAGGMLMAAFQVLVVNTMGPVGINAANVLKPSNIALTLFSPLGAFWRYA
ncbi:MAG: sulfite exporter TauE/SafE family protein, partial [Desulfobacula sp.]|nr:sulfite exporter TauE/SafE family protein [Desulfobacula sp.]